MGRVQELGHRDRRVAYAPPHHALLPEIAKRGFAFIERSLEPREGAVAAFLFMARSQFFHDTNKRTASLMMNGHLMRHGYCPICVLNRDAQAFHKELTTFYNTGDATGMMRFFAKTAKTMYGQEVAASFLVKTCDREWRAPFRQDVATQIA